MSNSFFRTALILGLMSAVGPFAIDMYLPALPRIAEDLNSSIAATQATLTAYFACFGLAQLVYGPWADQSGRKTPITFGVVLFILASVGCWLAPSMAVLTVFRGLQGLGAAVLMVIPRAVVRDLHTGPAATRMMAGIMLVISVSPMLAPLAGSGLIALGSWRTIFLVLALAACLALTLATFVLPETLPPERRRRTSLRSLRAGLWGLLTDLRFLGLTFIGGFGMASFFVFIASASFVYTEQFGLTPTQFSLAFAVNAIGFFTASQMAGPLSERFGISIVVKTGTLGFLLATWSLLVIALSGLVTLPVMMAFLFLGNAFLGVVIPNVMVQALDDHGDNAGLASSLGGTLQMVSGGVMIALSSPFFDGTATPMIGAIAICSLIAFTLSRLTLARRWSPA